MTNKQINTFISLALAGILALVFSTGIKESTAAAFRIEGPNMIVDQAGRILTIDEPFKRIISLYGAHTENLFNLGLDHEIIGVSRHETYPPRPCKSRCSPIVRIRKNFWPFARILSSSGR